MAMKKVSSENGRNRQMKDCLWVSPVKNNDNLFIRYHDRMFRVFDIPGDEYDRKVFIVPKFSDKNDSIEFDWFVLNERQSSDEGLLFGISNAGGTSRFNVLPEELIKFENSNEIPVGLVSIFGNFKDDIVGDIIFDNNLYRRKESYFDGAFKYEVCEINFSDFSFDPKKFHEKKIAYDLAIEITVGGDRFDRDDLFYVLRNAGMKTEDLAQLRKNTVELAKDMQPDGHEPDTVAFFNRSLDFWLDVKAYKEYCKPGMTAKDVDEVAFQVAYDLVHGRDSLEERKGLHESIVALNGIPEDIPKLRMSVMNHLVSFYEGVSSGPTLDEYRKSFERRLDWMLDKKKFSDVYKELVKDTGIDVKGLTAEAMPHEKKNEKPLSHKADNPLRNKGVSM